MFSCILLFLSCIVFYESLTHWVCMEYTIIYMNYLMVTVSHYNPLNFEYNHANHQSFVITEIRFSAAFFSGLRSLTSCS